MSIQHGRPKQERILGTPNGARRRDAVAPQFSTDLTDGCPACTLHMSLLCINLYSSISQSGLYALYDDRRAGLCVICRPI